MTKIGTEWEKFARQNGISWLRRPDHPAQTSRLHPEQVVSYVTNSGMLASAVLNLVRDRKKWRSDETIPWKRADSDNEVMPG